jgi:acyl-CoA reductase-like NAD-dependent aldehyde dehydrogenase
MIPFLIRPGRIPIRFAAAPREEITVNIASAITTARAAQREWSALPLEQRLTSVRRFRRLLADNVEWLAASTCSARKCSRAEALTSEILPLLSACRFLERNAPRLLKPRKLGWSGRPLWLAGTTARVEREPLGVILIIAPSNYPLFLAGVQTLQALVAGNTVLLKPGRGGTSVVHAFASLLAEAGFPHNVITVLNESVEAARAAIVAGPDKVLLTGSSETGEKVAELLGPRLIPSVMELGGCDPVLVRADADLALTAQAVAFGLRLNKGETCIAPRRIYVHVSVASELEGRLAVLLANDVFTNGLLIATAADDAEMVARANDCKSALGASVFTRDAAAGRKLASEIQAGVVTINDIIIPTADPRLPLGGRKHSGFGATRGAEGLLELTQPKVITLTSNRFRPAYQPEAPGDAQLFTAFARLAHGSLRTRWHALAETFRQLKRRKQLAS